ncbi:MAG: hypothetical protein K2H78_02915, partial [Clostridia bacterium]|nr:hypothetical protein [Clostridia bacterium]
ISTIDGASVSYRDAFRGEWKKSANSLISFAFDGLGTVTCSDGKSAATPVEYTPDGECVVFNWNDNEYKASINDEGVLIINNESYYLSDAFKGTWFMSGADGLVTLTLDGIGKNGFGTAVISYSEANVSVAAQYDVFRSGNSLTLRLFEGDNAYGELTYNAQNNKLAGLFYSASAQDYYQSAQQFSLYDAFRGTWVTNAADIDTLTFNGRTPLGAADVTLKLKNGKTIRGTYTLTAADGGTVTVKINGEEKTYTLKLDELANRVELKLADENIQLAQRDEWYRAVLTDGEKTYTFDGKG